MMKCELRLDDNVYKIVDTIEKASTINSTQLGNKVRFGKRYELGM